MYLNMFIILNQFYLNCTNNILFGRAFNMVLLIILRGILHRFILFVYYIHCFAHLYYRKWIRTRNVELPIGKVLDKKPVYTSGKADTLSFPSDETEIRVFIDRTSTQQRARRLSKQTEYNNIKIYIYIYILYFKPGFAIYILQVCVQYIIIL